MKTWRYIEENHVSAAYGLAVDEYLLQPTVDDFPATLRLYTYKNYSALAGRFQNIEAEIDLEQCRREGFDYSRRLTGGGAIIMGEDQLGICIAVKPNTLDWKSIPELYSLFSAPIIDALKVLGIEAAFQSKNDIEVNGKKIAGTGVHIAPNGAIQFHTSLLVDLDILTMLKVLKIPIQKYEDKLKIRAVHQRMTTVKDLVDKEVTLEEVKSLIKIQVERHFGIVLEKEVFLSNEMKEIEKLQREKYASDTWIFQYSPREDMTGMSLVKTPLGLLRTYIALNQETIKSVLITGDFVDHISIFTEIERRLKWQPLDEEHISSVVNDVVHHQSGSRNELPTELIIKAILLSGQRAGAAHNHSYNGSCYYPTKKILS